MRLLGQFETLFFSFYRKIELQHKILENETVGTEINFYEHKGVVEIDEKRHTDRKKNEETERQIKIEKHSDCKFVHKINPDAEGFDIFLKLVKYKITSLNQIKKN